MHAIIFVSSLKIRYKDALEKVLFFNINQYRLKEKVEESLESFGVPAINYMGDELIISFNDKVEYQTLFALDRVALNAELLGVIIYRVVNNTCQIIHLAINEFCTFRLAENEMIFFRLLEKLRIEMLLNDVEYIVLPYSDKRIHTSVKFVKALVSFPKTII